MTEEEKRKKYNKDTQRNRLTKNNSGKLYTITTTDMWRHYNYKREDKISKEKYVGLISDLFFEISKLIIYKRHVLTLPHLLGTIQLVSSKITTPLETFVRKNDKVTKKLERYLNTLGKFYSMKWINTHTKAFYNKKYYEFKFLNSTKARSLGLGGAGISKYVMDTQQSEVERLTELHPRKQ